jgi:sugar lactone lactonase YvrE
LDGEVTTLVSHHDGKRLNSPNDVVVKSDGGIWFTYPVYGISNDYEGGRQVSEQPPGLYRYAPESGETMLVAGDFDGATVCICIDPRGHLLGKVLLPCRVSNLAFGGPMKNRLFILASHTLYVVFLNRRGAQWP